MTTAQGREILGLTEDDLAEEALQHVLWMLYDTAIHARDLARTELDLRAKQAPPAAGGTP